MTIRINNKKWRRALWAISMGSRDAAKYDVRWYVNRKAQKKCVRRLFTVDARYLTTALPRDAVFDAPYLKSVIERCGMLTYTELPP